MEKSEEKPPENETNKPVQTQSQETFNRNEFFQILCNYKFQMILYQLCSKGVFCREMWNKNALSSRIC